MDTFQLNCFMAVAENLNFARAAEELHVTQPTVTRQIRSLESELGTELFHRSTRYVELTEDGRAFTQDAKNIIYIAAHSKLRFAHKDRPAMVQLSIGCFSLSQTDWLTDTLSKMNQLYPEFYPRIQIFELRQMYHLLQQSTLDIILGISSDYPQNQDIVYKEIVKCPLVACVREDSPLVNEEVLSISRIAEERTIFYDSSFAIPEIAKIQQEILRKKSYSDLSYATREEVIQHTQGTLYSEYAETAMALTEAGLGIAILPELLITRQNLIYCIPLEGNPEISLGVYYDTQSQNPAVRMFLHLIEEKFAD